VSRITADRRIPGIAERVLALAIATDLAGKTGIATRSAVVWIVKQRDPIHAKSLTADLIGFANRATATAIAVVPLEVAGDRLTVRAANELVLRAGTNAVDAHSRTVAAQGQIVAMLTWDRARAVADHVLRVERMPPRTGADPVDARRADFRTAVAVGLADLADSPADQGGNLDADAVLALESTAARQIGPTREPLTHARRHIRPAKACLIDQSARTSAESLEA
jgi:hypothetical protein